MALRDMGFKSSGGTTILVAGVAAAAADDDDDDDSGTLVDMVRFGGKRSVGEKAVVSPTEITRAIYNAFLDEMQVARILHERAMLRPFFGAQNIKKNVLEFGDVRGHACHHASTNFLHSANDF
jgi:hypothetical protein